MSVLRLPTVILFLDKCPSQLSVHPSRRAEVIPFYRQAPIWVTVATIPTLTDP